ncbi:MAG: type III pantothenate kinase [Candidatus Omnitrophota bacterium]
MDKKYILAIDIGNTTVALAVLRGERVVKVWRVESVLESRDLKAELTVVFKRIKNNYPAISKIISCSVVPRVSQVVASIIKQVFRKDLYFVGADIKVPMRNCYRNPRQVGQDRLVGAYAAKILYGVPVIVIDSGTAITFDIISKKGEYLGGMIIPGLRLSTESLFKRTALLPKIKIKTPKEIIGRDTESSILSGIFYGYGALCDGLIDLIAQKLKAKPKVILTGGHARLIRRFIRRSNCVIEEDLVFKGIHLIDQHCSR